MRPSDFQAGSMDVMAIHPIHPDERDAPGFSDGRQGKSLASRLAHAPGCSPPPDARKPPRTRGGFRNGRSLSPGDQKRYCADRLSRLP